MPKELRPLFEAFAVTAPGLESIAAGELKAMGIKGRQEVGGVAFDADVRQIYEVNLWLRTASRVVVRLGHFHASTFYELERRAKKVRWTDFLPTSGSVVLRVSCRQSRLYHSDAVGERVLSAIARVAPPGVDLQIAESSSESDAAEQADVEATGKAIATGDASNRSQSFLVRIVDDQCEISADSSGELLHRRGYRKESAKAPLRETLAAAMVLASGWNGKRGEPLLDPMCGSGTIPIEAALLARGIAPGLKRDFQFMQWPGFDGAAWTEILEKARGSVTSPTLDIRGADRDAGAIAAAMRNAERAGVAGDVPFVVESLSGSIAELRDVSAGDGWILANPPYGVRVGDSDDLRDLYATLGKALKAKRGWRMGILTSDAVLAGQMRIPIRPRFSSRNGGIPVRFLVSEQIDKAEARSRKSGVGGVAGGVK